VKVKQLANVGGVRLFVLLCVTASLDGCAALRNYPVRPNDVDTELQALRRYFDPAEIQKGGNTIAWRNEVVNSQILAIDLQFTAFEQEFARENVGVNTAVDMTVIGLGAATGVAGGAATKSILGAISGGITGAKGIIDKDLFYSKTMPVLLSQMEAQRKVQLVKIRTGLTADADKDPRSDASKYPLSEALIDVEEYYKAGSIPAALQGIIEQSGAAGQNATKDLKRLTAASAEDVREIRAVRDAFNVLFNAWDAAPDSEKGKKALADAKAILKKLRPNNQLDGRAVFEALDEEIQQAEPGSTQLAKVSAAFSGN
jgi:hypothetical protein